MMNVNDLYADQALAFIRRHQAAHLNRADLVARAIEHLQIGFDLSDAVAEQITVRALCEFESTKTSLYVDIDNSTASMIAVRDTRRNVTRVISIADIAQMLATAAIAPVRTPSYSDAMAGRNVPMSEAPMFGA